MSTYHEFGEHSEPSSIAIDTHLPKQAEFDRTGRALAPIPERSPAVDGHGFDPADYRWVPVRRRGRRDGWSEVKQRAFIEALADCGCVEDAARSVKMSVQSAYALRRAPGGESFAAAWGAAVQQGALKLADVAMTRALQGTDEPVFDRHGVRIGARTKYSERMVMFLLRAHLPERYAFAHRAVRPDDAPPPPDVLPMAEALDQLEPVQPDAPHALLSPDELENELQIADIMDGTLPERYQSPPVGEPSKVPATLSKPKARSSPSEETPSTPVPPAKPAKRRAPEKRIQK
ncbi:MAG: hypothetical protein WA954_09485 [Parerythrobacter sp.]